MSVTNNPTYLADLVASMQDSEERVAFLASWHCLFLETIPPVQSAQTRTGKLGGVSADPPLIPYMKIT